MHSNQKTLGNGCVCSHGCDSCTRLAEAFEAMREALTGYLDCTDVGGQSSQEFRPEIRKARAALRLAEGVKERSHA